MKLLSRGLLALVALLATHGALAAKPTVEDFFRNAQYAQVTVSPSGRYLATIAPAKNRRNIAIIDLKDRSQSKFITGLEDNDVAGYTWVSDDRIIFGVDSDGLESIRLYGVDREGGRIDTLIDPIGKDESSGIHLPSPTILDILEDDDKHVLISFDKRKVGSPDVYRMNVHNGGMKMVERNPGTVGGWMTDHDGKIRGAVAQDKLTTNILYRDSEKDEWQTIASYQWDDRNGFTPLGFDYDNKTWYVASTKDHDTAAIYKYDPVKREFGEMIFHHDDVDAGGLLWSDAKEKVVGVTYFSDKPGWVGLDEDYTVLRKSLDATFPERVASITSTDDDEKLMVIGTGSDVHPGEYFLYYVENRKLEPLVESRPWIDPEEMSPMRPISYQSRDGMTIHGYLTMPKGSDGKDLPLIVNPHGGPWARDFWGFNPEHQFFASRGYAVLQMNFRGSTGYGMSHLEAGYKQWGRAMQNDITDGVKWAIEQGIADEDRVCIYGGSYGGYATMAGMVFTPELYKCGVNYVGVTDIALLFETMPKRWDLGREQMKQQVGDPETEAEFLAEISPVNHVENIQAPVFIVHGRKDPRVNIDHANRLREEMEEHNKEYEWMVKNNEGHGFAKEENRIELYSAMEKFFAKHLGSGP